LNEVGEMARIGGWELYPDTKEVRWTAQTYRIHEMPEGEPIDLDKAITFFDLPEREKLEDALERAMTKGEPYDLQLPFTTATGKKLWTHTTGEAVKEDGRIVKLRGTFQDISAIKGAEEALRESEARYRLLADNTVDCIWIMDMDLEFTYINPAIEAMTGHTVEEWVGSRLQDHADEENFKKMADAAKEAIQRLPHNRPITLEAVMQGKDGSPIPVEITGKLILDEEGRPAALQGVTRDISERKELEEQVQQSTKMEAIGRLAGGVAHDFNNALTPILAVSGMMLEEMDQDHPSYEDIREIEEAGQRCAALTRQLLAFGRRQALDMRVMNLNDTVANMEKLLSRVIGEDIELIKFMEDGLGNVKADEGQIEQIIVNLAVNARDAMPNGGKLTIETDKVFLDEEYAKTHVAVTPGEYVMLAVSDTGQGMDEETIKHIFEPFYTTKKKGTGTGLGLATVYGIVKQSGGNIWVYSEPGKGTTFKMYLPRVDGEASVDRPFTDVSTERLTGSETILLVEDEEEVRRVAQRILTSKGYKVLEAASGEEAVELCENYEGDIDILVTDVVMPGMSGRELADKLIATCRGIKIVYMSGYTDNAIVHHGVLEKDTNFLQKPFTSETLAAIVREALDSGR